MRKALRTITCLALITPGLAAAEKKLVNPKDFLLKLQTKLAPTQVIPKNLGDILNLSEDKAKYFCAYDELQFVSIENSLLKDIKNSFKNKDIEKISGLLDPKGTYQLSSNGLTKVESKASIDKFEWSKNTKLSKKKFIKSLALQFKDIKEVNDIQIIVKNVGIPSKSRVNDTFNYNYANLTGFFEYSYTTKESKRRVDRANFTFSVTQRESGVWTLSSVAFNEGRTLVSNKAPLFKEVTKEIGLAEVPNYLRKEAIRRGGYTLAISDYNADKQPDLFLGTSQKGLFYKFKNGKFAYDKKNSELAPDLAKAAAFADFSNSNTQDLIIAKFKPVQDKSEVKSEVIMLKNDGKGNFSLKNKIINDKSPVDHPMPIAVADFNKDKYLDLYVGYPGAKDFTIMDNRTASTNKKRQDIYFNKKNGIFENKKRFFKDTFEFQDLYPHSSLAIDYDLDRDMDLLVIDDRANLSPAYENNNGQMTISNKKNGLGVNDYGMAISAADTNLNGTLDLGLSSVNFHAAERVRNSCSTNWDIQLSDAGTRGVRLFKGHKSGKYADHTEIAGLENPGEGIGGINFFDYNNDGLEDIYVTNGLWSGTDEYQEQSLSSLFYIMTNLDTNEFNMSTLGSFQEKTHSHFMNVLLNYEGDIYSPLNKNEKRRASLAGHQRNKLYRNNGDETFTEVGFLEGVDSIADGYMATTFDYNKDGNMDLVLRNADPGVSVSQFSPIQVFENKTAKNSSVTLYLKAQTSNQDAVGSILRAEIGGKTYTRHLTAVQGTIQAEKVIHFGLNNNKKIDKLTITWPNGKKSHYSDLKAGKYDITESLSQIVSR